jgi:CheY-like chemotaxis protein
MKDQPHIFVIEDNPHILDNVKLILENEGYEVKAFTSPKNALETLLKGEKIPDLITCDIKMAEMSGYDFYKRINQYPILNKIPFIFLTALSKPEDVRLGKMLGADEYITKPFKPADLLSTVSGKIRRYRKSRFVGENLEDIFSRSNIGMTSSLPSDQKDEVFLFFMKWDEKEGPKLVKYHPDRKIDHSTLNNVGNQLFQAFNSVFNKEELQLGESEEILVPVKNIDRTAYLNFFRYQENQNDRFVMLGTIAPEITYLHSLQIKKVLKEIKLLITRGKNWDIKEYWKKSLDILIEHSL